MGLAFWFMQYISSGDEDGQFAGFIGAFASESGKINSIFSSVFKCYIDGKLFHNWE